jgi:hypothetical protein
VNIDKTNPPAIQMAPLDYFKKFLIIDHWHLRKALQQGQYLASVMEMTAGQFPNNEGVAGHFGIVE